MSDNPEVTAGSPARRIGFGFGAASCPKCKSDNVRRSRRYRGNPMRALVIGSYRCRDCGAHFARVNLGIFVGGALVVLVIAFGIAGGWALREYHEPDSEAVEAPAAGQASAEPAATGAPEAGQTNAAGPSGEPAIAAPDNSSVLPSSGALGLSELAASGQARAQFSLGMSYLNGTGTAKDLSLAFKWFEKSAQQGYAEAQYALGSMYLAGRGALQNFESAYEWFEKAAQQNHAESQYRLGIMYRSGHAVPLDKARAYFWFNLAAAQGHERAAEARDNLLSALTSEQIARVQREAQAWKPTPAPN
jgi:TPR repeat protein